MYGNPEAQYNILYLHGRGVQQDEAAGVRWIRKAAEAGSLTAIAGLGWMYATGTGVPKDERKAVSLTRKAAKKGDTLCRTHRAAGDAGGASHRTQGQSQLNISNCLTLRRQAAIGN